MAHFGDRKWLWALGLYRVGQECAGMFPPSHSTAGCARGRAGVRETGGPPSQLSPRRTPASTRPLCAQPFPGAATNPPDQLLPVARCGSASLRLRAGPSAELQPPHFRGQRNGARNPESSRNPKHPEDPLPGDHVKSISLFFCGGFRIEHGFYTKQNTLIQSSPSGHCRVLRRTNLQSTSWPSRERWEWDTGRQPC